MTTSETKKADPPEAPEVQIDEARPRRLREYEYWCARCGGVAVSGFDNNARVGDPDAIRIRCATCEAIAALRALLAATRRELTCRLEREGSRWPGKDDVIGRGTGAAFKYGYECAWRGWGHDNVYVRADCRKAYATGYAAGEREFAAKLARMGARLRRSFGAD